MKPGWYYIARRGAKFAKLTRVDKNNRYYKSTYVFGPVSAPNFMIAWSVKYGDTVYVFSAPKSRPEARQAFKKLVPGSNYIEIKAYRYYEMDGIAKTTKTPKVLKVTK